MLHNEQKIDSFQDLDFFFPPTNFWYRPQKKIFKLSPWWGYFEWHKHLDSWWELLKEYRLSEEQFLNCRKTLTIFVPF